MNETFTMTVGQFVLWSALSVGAQYLGIWIAARSSRSFGRLTAQQESRQQADQELLRSNIIIVEKQQELAAEAAANLDRLTDLTTEAKGLIERLERLKGAA